MVRSLIDTQHETLTPEHLPPSGTTRRPSPRWQLAAIPLAVAAVAMPLVVAVAAFLPASLVADKNFADPVDGEPRSVEAPYARVPASAQPVGDRVSFGALEGVAEVDDDSRGDFLFVTISEPAQSVLSHWVGENEREIVPLTYEEKFGTSTPAQRRSISLQMMRTSEQVAQFVALQAVGYQDAEIVAGEVIVGSLVCLEVEGNECTVSAPADETLDPGDRLVSAEGRPVATVDDLGAALDGRQPGDVVELEIERPGSDDALTVSVELIDAPDGSGRAIVGFTPFDTATVQLPFEINIDSGSIGGPSAGLAFTLTLIDELSEGDLAGGIDVAVTGEMGLGGEVGAIGGLPQKVAAVKQVGVDHFLVPATQTEETLAEARLVAGDEVEIIPVATLDEALAALEALGGDPIVPVDDDVAANPRPDPDGN